MFENPEVREHGADPEEGQFDVAVEDDLCNEKAYSDEIGRINDCYISVCRALFSMSAKGDGYQANMNAHFEDVQRGEESTFSPIPDHIAQILDNEKAQRLARSQAARPHPECCHRDVHEVHTTFADDCRAFVDPEIPLLLPFDYGFHKADTRNTRVSVYHDLFYGDGTQCQFITPENNKRKHLEVRQNQLIPKRRPPPCYDAPQFRKPRKPLKVSSDFVPSCASVDHSEAQRHLREQKSH